MYSSEEYDMFDPENDLYDLPEDFLEYQEVHEEYAIDVWNYCCLLSAQSIWPLVKKLVLLNSVFGLTVSFINLPENLFHVFSASTGIYLALEVGSFKGKCILITYFMISYLILLANHYIRKYRRETGTFLKFGFVGSLILSEHLFVEKEVFLQIRGILMVMVMKILFLIDERLENKKPLALLQYLGYMLCGANILFGPWITYQEYIQLHSKRRDKGIFWVLGVFRSLMLSLVCLMISNCWATYLIPDKSNRWLLAYRDALSFRFSHYFVSYMAETGMVAAGFNNSKFENNICFYTIVSPLKIEFPTSLSVVVTRWNGPMHLFLKKSIYQPMRKYGQFASIMATFLVSSFLHGLEVRVSVVLLSLGIFSYLQVKARYSMSNTFNACLNVKPCKVCSHKYKRNHLGVRILLIIYSLTSVVHLAYLGILMDSSSSDRSIYEQWNDLYFISHIIIVFKFMLIL